MSCPARTGIRAGAVILMLALFGSRVVASPVAESLIVFVQPGIDPVAPTFRTELNAVAAERGLTIEFIDVSQRGAPAEITITPTIVYQNYRGRSIYQGRTTSVDRIRNFIRTSRYVVQGIEPNTRSEIPIRQIGRTRVWSPVKIAPVTGATPTGYDHAVFERKMRRAMARGFDAFTFNRSARLGRTDRGFYMDFYPWLSEDGTLFLSLSLFSQFHCKNPVFERKDDSLTGPWRKRKHLFRKAAEIMEAAVDETINGIGEGDGFAPVPFTVSVVNWEDLGLVLPPAPSRDDSATVADIAIPTSWVLDDAPSEAPMVQFRFPAPLSQYGGEFTGGTATFSWDPSLGIDSATGRFEIDPASVRTGESDLDSALRGGVFLDTKTYPRSSFQVDAVQGGGQDVVFGALLPVSAKGAFYLKGKEIALEPSMEIEAVIGDDGQPRLIIRGAFSINLDVFGIEGAEGPAPARHTVILDYNFTMRPFRR